MSTYDDRLIALEQKVADIELERLYEKKRVKSAPSEEAYDARQVNYRLAMLLGIATGQEHDVTSIKEDISTIKEQMVDIKQDINSFHAKFDQVLQMLTALTNKPEQDV